MDQSCDISYLEGKISSIYPSDFHVHSGTKSFEAAGLNFSSPAGGACNSSAFALLACPQTGLLTGPLKVVGFNNTMSLW